MKAVWWILTYITCNVYDKESALEPLNVLASKLGHLNVACAALSSDDQPFTIPFINSWLSQEKQHS